MRCLELRWPAGALSVPAGHPARCHGWLQRATGEAGREGSRGAAHPAALQMPGRPRRRLQVRFSPRAVCLSASGNGHTTAGQQDASSERDPLPLGQQAEQSQAGQERSGGWIETSHCCFLFQSRRARSPNLKTGQLSEIQG